MLINYKTCIYANHFLPILDQQDRLVTEFTLVV